MKKLFTVMLMLIAAFMIFSVKGLKAEASINNFDPNARNLDIGTKLRADEQNPLFTQEALQTIQENASKINFDENSNVAAASNEGYFTYNGGSKYFLGEQLEFIKFTLRSVGDNVEVWVADDLSYGYDRPADVVTQAQVDMLRDEFENNIHPTDTAFFGNEDTHDGTNALLEKYGYVPAGYYADNSKNIILIENVKDASYYANTGYYVAGFFWQTIERYIDRNIVTIDSYAWFAYMPNDNPKWQSIQHNIYGTLAHEYQHLIHADNDPYEETWINEGMSDFAQYLCGYGHNWGHVDYFMNYPENSLLTWDDYQSIEVLADYGQAYLLQLYLYDHFGEEFIRALATDTDHGIYSMNKILKQFNTGIDFNELFRRFSIAVAIDSPNPGNGIYNFDSIDLHVNYDSAMANDKFGVTSFGGQYSIIDNTDKIDNILVNSSYWSAVDLGGNNVFYTSVGNDFDNALIINADLTGLETATLEFDNMFNIEKEWDYGFVQVSTDNGKTWESLSNENTISDFDDNANEEIVAQGQGFSGTQDEFTHESFDLSNYAGQQIQIAFRYMTDSYTNGNGDTYLNPGWYIDNISIPELQYQNDCNSLDGITLSEPTPSFNFVFINERVQPNGKINYRIVSAEEYNNEPLQLRQLFKDGTNYMIVWNLNENGSVAAFDSNIINK